MVSGHLSPTEHSRTINAIIAQSMLATVYVASVGGMFLTGFALKIGLTDLEFGVISTVSMVASSLQLLSPFILEQVKSRRKVCVLFSALNVSMYWLLIAIPYVVPASPQVWRVYALWAVIGLASFFGSQVGPPLTSWWADLIPERQRGRFWAKVSSSTIPVGMILAVLEGAYLDEVKTLTGFSAIFIVGILFGYASVATLLS